MLAAEGPKTLKNMGEISTNYRHNLSLFYQYIWINALLGVT